MPNLKDINLKDVCVVEYDYHIDMTTNHAVNMTVMTYYYRGVTISVIKNVDETNQQFITSFFDRLRDLKAKYIVIHYLANFVTVLETLSEVENISIKELIGSKVDVSLATHPVKRASGLPGKLTENEYDVELLYGKEFIDLIKTVHSYKNLETYTLNYIVKSILNKDISWDNKININEIPVNDIMKYNISDVKLIFEVLIKIKDEL